MSIGSVGDWQNEYADIPLVSDDSWKQTLADYLGGLLDNLLTLQTYSPAPIFTFGKAAFVTGLAGADPSTPGSGVAALQTAFSAGVLASTMIATPPVSFTPVTPATTFSVVVSTLPDAPSIAAGQAKIAELSSAAETSDPLLSDFPVILREAFLLLTYTVIGTNSVAPTPGPLTDPLRGVE